jgi:hypothetical protein
MEERKDGWVSEGLELGGRARTMVWMRREGLVIGVPVA